MLSPHGVWSNLATQISMSQARNSKSQIKIQKSKIRNELAQIDLVYVKPPTGFGVTR
jgi:hypothetical protein